MTKVNIENNSSTITLSRQQVFWTMAGVMLAMLLGALDQTVVGTAMPRVVADLGGFNQYTWVTSIYMITSAVVVPIVGKLTDMYGRKIFYMAGIVIFVLSSLAAGFSQSMTQLIICRGIQGVGAGVMMANAFTVIGDLFAPAERGKYQGYMSSVWGLASVIGPSIGGFLTDKISWHWVFFVNVPLGALVIVIFAKYFPHLQMNNLKHKVDYAGLSFLILTVVPLMLALSWGGVEYAWGSPQILGMFIFSAIALVIFLLVETRASEPIMPLSLFKNQIVAISNLISFLMGMGMFGAVTFIPLYLQGVLGESATASGNMMIPMSIAVMISSFIAGNLIVRTGGRYKFQGILGMVLICLGLFFLTWLKPDSSPAMVIIGIIVIGLGMGTTMPVFTLAIQNAVPYSMLGVATSSSTFLRSLGGAVGLAILGSIMNNRFLSGFISGLPDAVKNIVSPDQITGIANNPQALVNPAAREQLQTMFSQAPDPTLFDQMMHALKQALSSAITDTFLIALAITAVGLAATFFLKEIPLRKDHPVHIDSAEKKPS